MPAYQFAQVSIGIWRVFEISDLAIIIKLIVVVRAKFINLHHSLGIPVTIKINC